jgi:hypothetical protein
MDQRVSGIERRDFLESPYPGLRPFQPEDADYFYGRDAQIDEVLVRLRQNRFVAVIGGSGSGKSSLVLAGAIPRLRSFAIHEAGDLWIPVIFTPGTNHVEGETPLKRLAKKFCAVLKDVDDPRARMERCVELLRERHGLARMVSAYSRDLKDPGWINLDDRNLQVNFLFLVDQFEELFDSTNQNEPVKGDCTALVNLLVDHFKMRDKQICVALTMRSEHLNDCIQYEDLPDAINATSYLVKRLDAAQFAEAIERPAMRFLRKRVAEERNAWLENPDGEAEFDMQQWPDRIRFDAPVIDRLRRDSEQVFHLHDSADYLPLLQHALFWTWDAARERCRGQAMPDEIRMQDLIVAVFGKDTSGIATGNSDDGAAQDTGAHRKGANTIGSVARLDENLNTLSACFQNQCERIFRAHEERQARWEEVFRSLSYKDPNTGKYTQQRARKADLCRRPEIALPNEEALRADLDPWLEPHQYLHWEADSEMVKVSHETFIRRWERFSKWTDEEDRQFQAYLRLLENCATWIEHRRDRGYLSEGISLRRFEDTNLREALQDADSKDRFKRLLAMHRNRDKLERYAGHAIDFLEASLNHRKRRLVLWWGGGVGLIASLVLVTELMLSHKERTLHRGYALAAETEVNLQPAFPRYYGAQLPLRMALVGARYYQHGRDALIGAAGAFPFTLVYSSRLDGVENAKLLGEGRNIASLKTVLQGAAWPIAEMAEAPMPRPDGEHARNVRAESGILELPDARFYPRPDSPDKGVITSRAAQSITVFVAERGAGGVFNVHNVLISTPSDESVDVGIAADLSNLVLEFKEYRQFYAVLWENPGRVELRPRLTVYKSSPNGYQPKGEVRPLETAVATFATDVVIGGDTLRLFAVGSTSIPAPPRTFSAMMPAAGLCGLFREQLKKKHSAATHKAAAVGSGTKKQSGASLSVPETEPEPVVWEAEAAKGEPRTYCLHVVQAPTGTSRTFVGTLYGFWDRRHMADSTKHFPLLGDIGLGETSPTEIRIDPQNGWLAFRSQGWRAMPWSLDAWRSLAKATFMPGQADLYPNEGQPFKLAYNLILGTDRNHVPSDLALKDSLPDAIIMSKDDPVSLGARK